MNNDFYYNHKTVNLIPPIFREKHGDWIVEQYESGTRGDISHTIYQCDPRTGKSRNRGTMPGCFWTDWQ